ncbi:hypothetical protein HPB48_001494 [Haemaphysalis longicornis]|uniref:Uncharacterized protein n=1 Tax=Haemaphysalis longicornis TaxID=44386 RepID=A0A9J6FGY7_HAELO|nr:hypothetical protein HPB48_001494 [Haemaphysalis longicornis]
MLSKWHVVGKVRQVKDSGVGKSSILQRFVYNTFNSSAESTIGASFMMKNMVLHDRTFKFNIWDTAGQERYRALAPMYYRGAAAAIIVYDITSRESFNAVQSWVRELQLHGEQNIALGIAGNKCDLEDHREVSLARKGQQAAMMPRCGRRGGSERGTSGASMGQSHPTGSTRRRRLSSLCRPFSPHSRNLSATFHVLDTELRWELLNINSATEEELMTLPGVTRCIARNIVDYRQAIGGFKKVEDLALVSGVGASRLQMFRSEITVRRGPPVSSRSPRVCAPPQRSPLRDMELYRLVAPLSQRPLTARMEAGPAGAFWVALWNLAGLTCDKASNLGVLEVVCRTALENGGHQGLRLSECYAVDLDSSNGLTGPCPCVARFKVFLLLIHLLWVGGVEAPGLEFVIVSILLRSLKAHDISLLFPSFVAVISQKLRAVRVLSDMGFHLLWPSKLKPHDTTQIWCSDKLRKFCTGISFLFIYCHLKSLKALHEGGNNNEQNTQ